MFGNKTKIEPTTLNIPDQEVVEEVLAYITHKRKTNCAGRVQVYTPVGWAVYEHLVVRLNERKHLNEVEAENPMAALKKWFHDNNVMVTVEINAPAVLTERHRHHSFDVLYGAVDTRIILSL